MDREPPRPDAFRGWHWNGAAWVFVCCGQSRDVVAAELAKYPGPTWCGPRWELPPGAAKEAKA